jgi:hypothetical protein
VHRDTPQDSECEDEVRLRVPVERIAHTVTVIGAWQG